MKVNKVLLICLIGLSLTCGLVLFGCGTKCDYETGCGFNQYSTKICTISKCSVNRVYNQYDHGGMTAYANCDCD